MAFRPAGVPSACNTSLDSGSRGRRSHCITFMLLLHLVSSTPALSEDSCSSMPGSQLSFFS